MITLDSIFIQSAGNTFRYLVYSILLQIPLAYFLAIVLTRGSKGEKGIRIFKLKTNWDINPA
jgi:ABC-type sugar transport system permease subunit